MKTVLLLAAFMFGTRCVIAQRIDQQTQTVDGRTFIIDTISYAKMVELSNSDNKLKNVKSNIPKNLSETYLNYVNFNEAEKSKLYEIVQESLSNRTKLLKGRKLTVKYYIAPSGKILELSFLIERNSVFTISDLKKIEDNLKSKYKFLMNNTLPSSINYISFIMPVSSK